jgi:hypothetical protein
MECVPRGRVKAAKQFHDAAAHRANASGGPGHQDRTLNLGTHFSRHSPDGSYRKLRLLQFGFPGKAEPSRLRAWPSR